LFISKEGEGKPKGSDDELSFDSRQSKQIKFQVRTMTLRAEQGSAVSAYTPQYGYKSREPFEITEMRNQHEANLSAQ